MSVTLTEGTEVLLWGPNERFLWEGKLIKQMESDSKRETKLCVIFFVVFVSQPSAVSSAGSVELHHPHLGSGKHHLSLQAAGVSKPGGSAALGHDHQVSFQPSNAGLGDVGQNNNDHGNFLNIDQYHFYCNVHFLIMTESWKNSSSVTFLNIVY